MSTLTVSKEGDNRQDRIDAEVATHLFETRLQPQLDAMNGRPMTIDLSRRVYLPEGAETIAKLLRPYVELNSVEHVNMNEVIATLETSMGLRTLQIFNDLFASSPLVSLNLDGNALGARGVPLCQDMLKRPTLRELMLNDCGVSEESMSLLHDCLVKEDGSCNMESICLHNNMIGVEGSVLFAKILARCTKLRKLDFSFTRPRAKGTEALLAALQSLQENSGASGCSIQHLDIGGLVIKTTATRASLQTILARSPQLTHLSLFDCDLKRMGMKYVAQGLIQSGASLKELNLISNYCRLAGIKFLLPYLQQTTWSLEVLLLEENELRSEGLACLLGVYVAPQGDIALKKLSLNLNQIGHVGAEALLQMKLPSTLEVLDLNENGFSEEEVESLEAHFGSVITLQENEDDEDYDGDSAEEESEDEEEEEEKEAVEEQKDADVDDLTQQLESSQI